jgi:hypothetical protein
VSYAANIDKVISWLEDASASAILVSSHLFGPDVMVQCSGLLLMGQFKSYTGGNKDSLDAETLTKALISLTPTHWFKRAVRRPVFCLALR